jgi:antitoxin HicB
MRTYTIVIVPDDGIYAVFVPALPGCVTQGSTVDEAIERAREAITGHIAALEAIGEDIPEESAPAHLAVIAISTPALQLAG